ncbi:MAG: hypothetical protein KDC87_02235, partial [Planctomycetes bacterium]|nr:hypothetical protein [Planctomycetota bacterium]
GNRIAGTVVDIGADEFEGPFGWVVGVPRVGGTIHAGVTGTSNAPVFLAIAVASLVPTPIPGLNGMLEVDLARPNVVLGLTTGAQSFARVGFVLPNDPLLPGFEVFLQCLDPTSRSLGALDRLVFVQ